GPALVTGANEEAAKAAAVVWVLRRKRKDLIFEMDGIILGAAAGMGFAAIEDMLYAVGSAPHGLDAVLATVWVREILGPFGHGTWTAIVVGTIWRVRDAGFVRGALAILGAYLLAVALHGAWDWDPVSGYGALVWLLGVGAVGIVYLRSMIHHALQQEKEYLDQTGTATATAPSGQA
ncbi:MAG TPA: PrsW family glutamic-type intramembrane protease, partial [Chloroflexota bacterium]|nr:PrsW family glutamic-type intramembrane protease [Chloroflexota bacterium]